LECDVDQSIGGKLTDSDMLEKWVEDNIMVVCRRGPKRGKKQEGLMSLTQAAGIQFGVDGTGLRFLLRDKLK